MVLSKYFIEKYRHQYRPTHFYLLDFQRAYIMSVKYGTMDIHNWSILLTIVIPYLENYKYVYNSRILSLYPRAIIRCSRLL